MDTLKAFFFFFAFVGLTKPKTIIGDEVGSMHHMTFQPKMIPMSYSETLTDDDPDKMVIKIYK